MFASGVRPDIQHLSERRGNNFKDKWRVSGERRPRRKTVYLENRIVIMSEITTSQTPPVLHKPSEKERKYDRQLRLWAASGQSALESAHILLLNSGSGVVGIETLKNLVLPGRCPPG